MLLNYYELFIDKNEVEGKKSEQQVDEEYLIWMISFIAMLSTGIVMGFIRTFDPIYVFTLK